MGASEGAIYLTAVPTLRPEGVPIMRFSLLLSGLLVVLTALPAFGQEVRCISTRLPYFTYLDCREVWGEGPVPSISDQARARRLQREQLRLLEQIQEERDRDWERERESKIVPWLRP